LLVGAARIAEPEPRLAMLGRLQKEEWLGGRVFSGVVREQSIINLKRFWDMCRRSHVEQTREVRVEIGHDVLLK
jgi:hypothetical protein